MSLIINWNTDSLKNWERNFKKIEKSNILQSYTYARVACSKNNQKARWGIIEVDGAEAGIVQILEASILKGLVHAVILDRGPLWFPGFGKPAQIKSFFVEFNRQFPRRLGRKRRILPEIEKMADSINIFDDLRYKPVKNPPYETVWIDLSLETEDLQAKMKKNWRGSLKKALNTKDLKVLWVNDVKNIAQAVALHQADQDQRSYQGASPDMLFALAVEFAKAGNLLLGHVMMEGRLIAVLMTFIHGNSATYQMGWVSEDGRKMNANHLLLWESCLQLKKRDIKWYDLGGVNDESAAGIKKFKCGTGGQLVEYIGQFS